MRVDTSISSIFEMLISLISTRKRIKNKLCLQETHRKKESRQMQKILNYLYAKIGKYRSCGSLEKCI
jgi:hypothetical protein